MIPFNRAVCLEESLKYIQDTMCNHKISGDGVFTRRCSLWMEERFCAKKVLMTTSGTAALEMAAILLDIKVGDEVIMPSYTFVSTANAFVIRGAKVIFVDIRPDTMNIDEKLIEKAITERTKAIVVVHYAGVSCEMDEIMRIAREHSLFVVEDAAQGVMAEYRGKALGTIGDIGCYSFHETKNYTMGEGGAIVLNNESFIDRAEIIREKGTNRSRFFRGEIDKYSWVDIGSSYLPSDINAALLLPQLEIADVINNNRLDSWMKYYNGLNGLADCGRIELPVVPCECKHNAHMFYVKVKNLEERSRLLAYLKSNGVSAVFHYVPLHSTEIGTKYGMFFGDDIYTTRESERLFRLPMYYDIAENEVEQIIMLIKRYYDN